MVSFAVITSKQPSKSSTLTHCLSSDRDRYLRRNGASATRWVIRCLLSPHGIKNVGQLPGERRDGHLCASTFGDSFRPLDHRVTRTPKIESPGGLAQSPSGLRRP